MEPQSTVFTSGGLAVNQGAGQEHALGRSCRIVQVVDQQFGETLANVKCRDGDRRQLGRQVGDQRSHRLSNKGPAMYDEITRVPFLARWPGVAPKGVVCSHPVSHIGISGTIMDYLGLAVPKTLQGTTMLDTFRHPERAPRKEVFLEFTRYAVNADGFGGYQPIRCIFDGRFKLSVHLLSSDELYDLDTDPGEMHNLIRSVEYRKIRNDLHDRLLSWMGETRDPARGYYWGRRPWRPDFPETWQNAGMRRQRASDGYLPRELDYSTGLPMKSITEQE